MKRVMLLSAAMVLTFAVIARGEDKIDAPKNDQGAYVLFNGKDLSGWEGDPKFWSVKDGAITGSTRENKTNGNTFLIWRGGKVKDFELRAMSMTIALASPYGNIPASEPRPAMRKRPEL